MKSNNFQQPQNYLNNSLNKNPYRIQNYNYMFYLVQDNPQLLYSIQNYYLQLYQLGLLQNSQQAQLFNLANGQNVHPLYYNIAYNNLFQLRLLNANNNILAQNQNLLPYINNINSFQNIQNIQNNQSNTFLNKKTFNFDHFEVIKDNKIENKDIESNNINEEEKVIKNTLLINDEMKNDENKLEIKNIEKKDDKNNIEEKNEICTRKKEDINDISITKNKEKNEISTIKMKENNEISTTKNEVKNDEAEIKNKRETKKKKKRRTNYKDLLYDPLLEQLDKEEKQNSKKDIELEEEDISASNTHNKKKEKNKKSSNANITKTKQKQKSRNKNGKNSRKKQHKKTLKNNKDILADLEENKNNEDNMNYPRIIFHVDGTQAVGKKNISLDNIDLYTFSGHKIYGLKGIGCLIKKEHVTLEPLIHGGKSQSIFRAGTPALPLIVSFAKALKLIINDLEFNYRYVSGLNERLINGLKNIDGVIINSNEKCLPHIVNISIIGIKPETMLHALEEDEIYISTKTACSSLDDLSLGVYEVTKDEERAKSSIRISISHLTKSNEIDFFLEKLKMNVEKLRSIGS